MENSIDSLGTFESWVEIKPIPQGTTPSMSAESLRPPDAIHHSQSAVPFPFITEHLSNWGLDSERVQRIKKANPYSNELLEMAKTATDPEERWAIIHRAGPYSNGLLEIAKTATDPKERWAIIHRASPYSNGLLEMAKTATDPEELQAISAKEALR